LTIAGRKMKLPLFLAHGFELLAFYLTLTAIGYLLASLSLWLAWKGKRLGAVILCVPAIALSALLASTIHVFWGKIPFVISLAAIASVFFRTPAASKKEAIQPSETTRGN
jgi:hypothetical protein